MLGKDYYYNRTIRKIVVAFGTLFNDIVVVRKNLANNVNFEQFKVPLSYGPKEKYITRLESDSNLVKSINTMVPRISFDLVGITYDASRKQVSSIKNYAVTNGVVNSQYAPIPYNFEFSLSIYIRNTEDGTQILEQILPFFTPDFTVTVDLIEGMNQKYDIPIILDSVAPNIDYEGDMSTTRLSIWELSFTVKAFLFPPVIQGGDKIIKQANTNIYIDTQSRQNQRVYVDYANSSGVFVTNETIRVVDKNITGIVTYYANNSTGTLVVEELNELLSEGDIISGDYSNARATIDFVDLNPVKEVSIIVRPNPPTANVDDDYGFTEIINEFPDTL
jgi:hypothetical protein